MSPTGSRRSAAATLRVACLLLLLVSCEDPGARARRTGLAGEWAPRPAPVIRYKDHTSPSTGPSGTWTDPHVLQEGDGTYRMWLTSSDISRAPSIAIYEATSPDGINWKIDTDAQLVPGGTNGGWDSGACAAPTVVRVEGAYHMYFSGTGFERPVTEMQIGHAASPFGVVWTKDPDPVITRPATPNEWGWLGVSDPAVVHVEGTFFLYYTMVRCRDYDTTHKECRDVRGRYERAIGVATSTDGIYFEPYERNPILVQTGSHPANEGYEGYSAPTVYVDRKGKFHMFYAVCRDGGRESLHIALAYASSEDGFSFHEVQPKILDRSMTRWSRHQIRSPTVLNSEGLLKMWFGGNAGQRPADTGFELGIGYAELR